MMVKAAAAAESASTNERTQSFSGWLVVLRIHLPPSLLLLALHVYILWYSCACAIIVADWRCRFYMSFFASCASTDYDLRKRD